MKRDKLGRFIKGYHYNPQTEFKKGEHLGENHPRWKGGRYKLTIGYIAVLNRNHPKANKQGYVYEHILVLEKKLGRSLKKGEVSHHLNGIKDDNRPENLVAIQTSAIHTRNHLLGKKRPDIAKYEQIYKKPFPIPDREGKIVSYKYYSYIVKRCKKCNQLFWTQKNYNAQSHLSCYKKVNILPTLKELNKKVSYKGLIYIVKECIRCKKLFWTRYVTKKVKYCSPSCAVLMGRYDK